MCGVGEAQGNSTQPHLRTLLRPGRAHSDKLYRSTLRQKRLVRGGAGRQFIAVTNVARMSSLLDTNEKPFPFCATENPFSAWRQQQNTSRAWGGPNPGLQAQTRLDLKAGIFCDVCRSANVPAIL